MIYSYSWVNCTELVKTDVLSTCTSLCYSKTAHHFQFLLHIWCYAFGQRRPETGLSFFDYVTVEKGLIFGEVVKTWSCRLNDHFPIPGNAGTFSLELGMLEVKLTI